MRSVLSHARQPKGPHSYRQAPVKAPGPRASLQRPYAFCKCQAGRPPAVRLLCIQSGHSGRPGPAGRHFLMLLHVQCSQQSGRPSAKAARPLRALTTLHHTPNTSDCSPHSDNSQQPTPLTRHSLCCIHVIYELKINEAKPTHSSDIITCART